MQNCWLSPSTRKGKDPCLTNNHVLSLPVSTVCNLLTHNTQFCVCWRLQPLLDVSWMSPGCLLSLIVIVLFVVEYFFFYTPSISQSILPFFFFIPLGTKSLSIDPILKVKSSHFCGGELASCGVLLSRRDCGCYYGCCAMVICVRDIHRHRISHLQHLIQTMDCMFDLLVSVYV